MGQLALADHKKLLGGDSYWYSGREVSTKWTGWLFIHRRADGECLSSTCTSSVDPDLQKCPTCGYEIPPNDGSLHHSTEVKGQHEHHVSLRSTASATATVPVQLA